MHKLLLITALALLAIDGVLFFCIRAAERSGLSCIEQDEP